MRKVVTLFIGILFLIPPLSAQNTDLGKLAQQFYNKTYGTNGTASVGRSVTKFSGQKSWDLFGHSVAGAGDVNGDGYADIVIGAYQNDDGGNNAGKVYVYFGGPNMDRVADVVIQGETDGNNSGCSVACAGDVNGDGYDDIITGAQNFDINYPSAGRAYIFFGGPNMDCWADVTLNGEGASNWFGASVSSAGDVNGDGYDDVIVGAYGNSSAGSNTGRAYIFFGGASMDNTADVIMTGEAAGNYFGQSVASAGDINGDGYDDVIVGAEGDNSLPGKAYIFFGGHSMDNTADVTMLGEANGDCFGVSVSTAGDVNGDGYDDVIVGAEHYNNYTGRAYIFWGGANMDGNADVTLDAEVATDHFGTAVARAGDINGDGYSDVIVSANYNDEAGNMAGKAYIFFGGRQMDNTADESMTGENSEDNFGVSVSCAGDVNGDGYDDVLIGADYNDPNSTGNGGAAYLYTYKIAGKKNQASWTATGEHSNDSFGHSVATAGDVNGDGYDDVIIGAYENNDGGTDAGKAYIYFGGPSMDNTADVTMTGEAAEDFFGLSVASAGDVNGDGYDDVIIGAIFNDDGGLDAGKAYLYFGGPSMNNTADVTMIGETAEDYFARSVASAGDVNGDGYDDVIIGADHNDDGGTDAGKAYIYFGGQSMDNTADVTITGEADYDHFGISVATAGDVNRDGYDDVIVGAYHNDNGGAEAGKTYLYFGGQSMDNTADVTMIGEAAEDYFGCSVASAGDVNGDGYDDVIIGADHNDDGTTNAGKAYLYFGGSSMDNTADVTMTGEAIGDIFGHSVASAGDVNGDGYDDVIIGAHWNDDSYGAAGKTYLYLGGPSMDNRAEVTMSGEGSGDYFGGSVASAGDVNGDGYDDVIIGAIGYHSYLGKAYIYFSNGQSVKPSLFYAQDVPQDQGGYVLLKWSRSSYDTKSISKIIQYVVQRSSKPSAGWENLAEIAATHQSYYNYTAKTQYDSSSSTPAIFYYRIVAKTSSLQEMWLSNQMRAHSVDNLPPSQTQGALAKQTGPNNVLISWDANTNDADLGYYEVHRSTQDGFTPNSQTLIKTTTDTSYLDTSPVADVSNYYKIIAVDVHENKGTPSSQTGVYVDSSLPVFLVGFSVKADKTGYPIICFETGSETNTLGFNILRSTGKDSVYKVLVSYKQTEALRSKGNSAFGAEYTFTDRTVKNKHTYWYQLQSVDLDGSLHLFYAVSFEVKLVPEMFYLEQNYPNPFNPTTTISYQLPETRFVTLAVFNSLGQKVKTLVNKNQEAGIYSVSFDATGLASGIYYYKLSAGNFVRVKKMILLR